MDNKSNENAVASNKVEGNLTLGTDICQLSTTAATAAATTAMKTQNTTNTVGNTSGTPLTLETEHRTGTTTTTIRPSTVWADYPPPRRDLSLHDVVLNDWDYGNAKFHKWIMEHREAFSLATSLSAQTILIQGLIQRVKKHKGKFLERTQNGRENWVELSDDAVTLGVAKALRSSQEPGASTVNPTHVRRVSRPPSPIGAMNVDQLQFTSVMCIYSTPLWSFDAPMYAGVPSGNTIKARKAAPKKKPKTTTIAGSALSKAVKPNIGTNVTATLAVANEVVKKRSPPSDAAETADGEVKKRRMPARQIANSSDISPDGMASCSNTVDPEMALEAYRILQSIEVQSLPRGVTARPSGKWQAQFYFAGQSRYIGVFDSAKAAAQAYECVHRLLAQSRPGNATRRHSLGGSSTTSTGNPMEVDPVYKRAMRKLFERARDAALEAVTNLQQAQQE